MADEAGTRKRTFRCEISIRQELLLSEKLKAALCFVTYVYIKLCCRKFTYRGVDLDQLLDMSTDELVELFCARQRRRSV